MPKWYIYTKVSNTQISCTSTRNISVFIYVYKRFQRIYHNIYLFHAILCTYKVFLIKKIHNTLAQSFFFDVVYSSQTVPFSKAWQHPNTNTVCQILPDTGSIIKISNLYALACRMTLISSYLCTFIFYQLIPQVNKAILYLKHCWTL